MADRLTLSVWLRNHGPLTMVPNFEKLLSLFPYSQLAKVDAVFRIYSVSYTEPILLETPLPLPFSPEDAIHLAREFQSADNCYELSGMWDLWTYGKDWNLAPARITLAIYGPEFEREQGESLRIDFGLEDQFLPAEDADDLSLPMIRANIQSLLRLVKDIDTRLPVEKKLLWSESGENFAERLQDALGV